MIVPSEISFTWSQIFSLNAKYLAGITGVAERVS